MRGPVERTVAEHIPAPPSDVRAHYADLHNLAAVHPLIESVTVVADSLADGVRETTYRIKDRVPVGFLTVPVTYTAIMRVPADGPVTSRAIQFPAVRLESQVFFESAGGGTELRERLVIIAPRPLLALTVRRAVAAHTEMLAGIRRAFEV